MYIDKFKKEDGFYSEDGCLFETAEDFIHTEMFGFCSCGDPEENLKFIMHGLAHIDKLHPDDDSDWWDDWVKEGVELFGSEGVKYFFFYWADKEGLTEHGGSVPGWLTDKGHHVLSDLREMYDNEGTDDQS